MWARGRYTEGPSSWWWCCATAVLGGGAEVEGRGVLPSWGVPEPRAVVYCSHHYCRTTSGKTVTLEIDGDRFVCCTLVMTLRQATRQGPLGQGEVRTGGHRVRLLLGGATTLLSCRLLSRPSFWMQRSSARHGRPTGVAWQHWGGPTAGGGL